MNHSYFLITISAFLSLLSGSSAAAKDRLVFKGIEGTLMLGTQYDDNTNDYSEKYLTLFKNAEDPGRFHIATFDDAVACAKLSLEGAFNFFKKRRTIIDASAFYKMYANNTIDRNGKFSIGLSQQVARKTYLHATYSLVPHYYLYHFRDKDWSTTNLGTAPKAFQPFDYAKDAFSLRALRYLWKGSSLSCEFIYSRYFYNEHYTEYNSKRYAVSLHGSQTLPHDIVATCDYGFGLNDAKGYDGDVPGETKQSSDDADDSFQEHRGALGARWHLPELFNRQHSVSINGALRNRDYSSPKGPEIDRTHAGRFEYTARASAAYTIWIAEPLGLQVEYARTQRWAGSSYAENNDYIKEKKDYSKNTAAFTLQYTFDW